MKTTKKPNTTSMRTTTKNRYPELDILRGTAIIGMIIFHLFFILDYTHFVSYELYEGLWLLLARYVQITFIGIFGISLAISAQNNGGITFNFIKKQLKRSATVYLMAMIISIFSYLIVPDMYIRFGILHFISISILLLIPLADKKILPIFLGISILALSPLINQIPNDNELLLPIGLNNTFLNTIDYFSIFPWISVSLLGIAIGNTIYPKKGRAEKSNPPLFLKYFFSFLSTLGKNSLFIYMLHIPILILLAEIISFLIFRKHILI